MIYSKAREWERKIVIKPNVFDSPIRKTEIMFMVIYLRYSGKKQMPNIAINLFSYCNSMIIMNLFFFMLSTGAPFTSIKDYCLRVQCGLAANASYRLFSLVEVGNEITSYHVRKLVKVREKTEVCRRKV